ncbi:MAG: AAA family ATPase [Clostridia bacterium]|nr:AAA family ATPase [Clostridia bacterium]
MKLVFIMGDAASGKMTVGQELCKRTGLRLHHNHMTIEPVLEIFGYFHGQAISRIREVIFQEFAATDLPGMVFTYMMAFDLPSEWEALEKIKDIFRPYNTEFYYVELDAPLEVRLQRNRTENRLKHKASKRDIETSDMRLIQDAEKYRCISYEGEVPFDNYLRIDNSQITAAQAAEMILERFPELRAEG